MTWSQAHAVSMGEDQHELEYHDHREAQRKLIAVLNELRACVCLCVCGHTVRSEFQWSDPSGSTGATDGFPGN